MPDTDCTQRNDLAAAALVYAEAGTAILPLWWPAGIERCACPAGLECESPGKHPLTINGVKDATNEVNLVHTWWSRWPKANIGAAMTNEMFVIDIDPHNGGENTWLELSDTQVRKNCAPESVGNEVITRTSLSGRGDGGRHLWLSHPGIRMKGRLGVGVDVKRIPNSFVVAPPSIHATTLQVYRWIDSEMPIATPPSWLVELLRERDARASRSDDARASSVPFGRWNPGGLLHTMATATNGNRNNILFWCAATIGDDVSAGKAREPQAFEALDVLAEIAESTGLSTLEVDRTIRSAYRR